MNEQFFYKYAQEIKELFIKHNVTRCLIRPSALYVSLCLDCGADLILASNRRLALKKDLWDLAYAKMEIININYFSSLFIEHYSISEKFVDFDFFLYEGLIKNANKGNKDLVEALLRVVPINYRSANYQQTALHASLYSLVTSRSFFNSERISFEKTLLKCMQEVKEIIKLLINFPGFDWQIQDKYGMTVAAVAINSLPVKNNGKPLIDENLKQAESMVEEVLLMLQNKGIVLDIAALEGKGYSDMAKVLHIAHSLETTSQTGSAASALPDRRHASKPYFLRIPVVESTSVSDALKKNSPSPLKR